MSPRKTADSSKTASDRAAAKAKAAEERKKRLAAQLPSVSFGGFNSDTPEVAEAPPEESPAPFEGFTLATDPSAPPHKSERSATVPPQQAPEAVADPAITSAGSPAHEANQETSLSEPSVAESTADTRITVQPSTDATAAAPLAAASTQAPAALPQDVSPGVAESHPSSFTQASAPAAAPRYGSDLAPRTSSHQGLPAVTPQRPHGALAPRRGARRRVERFDPTQRPPGREQALQALQAQAPRYSALLLAYGAGQLNTVPHENRNVHLYGATFELLANQATGDKALLKQLTQQRHKLTPAHYVDAALEAVLAPLDPLGTDEDAIEAEKDYVEELADRGYAYRAYVLNDPYLANLDKQRPVCSLRSEVNGRVTRLMDLLSSMPGIKIQPFEIISAVVTEYLNHLPAERPHLAAFFKQHTVTTIQ